VADADFPALEFDPAVGNVATVRDLAKQMTDTGTYAKEAFDVLKSIQDKKEVWTGEASKAFAGKLGELPGYLDNAQQSLTAAGKALSTWGDKLEAHQQKARDLEAQAKQAKADYDAKNSTAQNARSAALQQSDSEQLHNEAVDKIGAANTAWDRLEDIRNQAKDLMDTWEDDGGTCADALGDAGDKAPNKSFFDSFGEMFDDLGKWFKDHLGDIGDIAGIVAAVAGALSFIPILAPITGPIALIAGGIALAAHAGDMTVNGKWDDPNAWITLGSDVVGMIPGGKLVGEGFKVAGDAAQAGTKLVDAAAAGGRAIASGARELPEAGKVFTWVAEKTVGNPLVHPLADTAAKGLQAGANVALQIPGTIGLFDSSQSTTDGKNAAGVGGLLLNVIQAF
jgi:hypothetical protein